jgi:nitroreductase
MTEQREAAHHIQERPLSALDAIFMRRSVRAYTTQKLDEATIRSLLDAAVQAPTAMHLEPWAFVVIQDQATLKRYSDRAKGSWAKEAAKYRDLHAVVDASTEKAFAERFASPDFCVFYDASTLIVICARPMGPFVVADCWLAAENLMLAACALGLGTCCIGSAIPALNSPEGKPELDPRRRRSCRTDYRRGAEWTGD